MSTQTADFTAAVKRTGAGRPRQEGAREPNGRLSRQGDIAAEKESVQQRAQRLAQRIVMVGDEGYGLDLADPIEVLAALGHINDQEASAATEVRRLHDLLFGRPHPKTMLNGSSGPTPDPNREAQRLIRARARYDEAWKIIGRAGGNAVAIVRYVCAGNQLPIWAGISARPLVTVARGGNKLVIGGKQPNRAAIRAMRRDLPALRRALNALASDGFVTERKRRRVVG